MFGERDGSFGSLTEEFRSCAPLMCLFEKNLTDEPGGALKIGFVAKGGNAQTEMAHVSTHKTEHRELGALTSGNGRDLLRRFSRIAPEQLCQKRKGNRADWLAGGAAMNHEGDVPLIVPH